MPSGASGSTSRRHRTAGDLVLDYLADHRERLRDADRRVRAEEPEGVHDLRVAARRARSALASARSLLVPDAGEALVDELRWVGQVLGRARDAEVLRERLLSDLDALSATDVTAAAAAIDAELGAAAQAGRVEALAALDGDRYAAALAAFDALLADPPLAGDAELPAAQALPDLLRRDRHRVARRVRAARQLDAGPARDASLHAARKAAKRLRYAAELAVPLAPKRAGHLVDAVTQVQDTLGLRQDAVVAMAFLAELAGGQVSSEVAFELGQVDALEARRAAEAEQAFFATWSHVPKVHPQRWR